MAVRLQAEQTSPRVPKSEPLPSVGQDLEIHRGFCSLVVDAAK